MGAWLKLSLPPVRSGGAGELDRRHAVGVQAGSPPEGGAGWNTTPAPRKAVALRGWSAPCLQMLLPAARVAAAWASPSLRTGAEMGVPAHAPSDQSEHVERRREGRTFGEGGPFAASGGPPSPRRGPTVAPGLSPRFVVSAPCPTVQGRPVLAEQQLGLLGPIGRTDAMDGEHITVTGKVLVPPSLLRTSPRREALPMFKLGSSVCAAAPSPMARGSSARGMLCRHYRATWAASDAEQRAEGAREPPWRPLLSGEDRPEQVLQVSLGPWVRGARLGRVGDQRPDIRVPQDRSAARGGLRCEHSLSAELRLS